MNKHDALRIGLGLACIAALALALRPARAGEKTANASGAIKHVDAKQAAELVAKGGLTVLDIRTPQEFADGHLAGATNLDFQAADFAAQLAKLDREKAYLLHCNSGRRTTNSLPQFEKLGFKHILHLDGGFKAWTAAGNPVTKP